MITATINAQLAFEAASVKLNTSSSRDSFSRITENAVILQNWSLRRIILKAYDLKDYALTGPGWLASRNFDINAKSDGPVAETTLRQMLQHLLAERFGLKTHTVPEEKPVYVLLPTKNGFKPKPVTDGSSATDDCDLSRFPDKTRISCRHSSLENLTDILSGQLNSIVVDQSEVRGTYAFTFEWSPDLNADGGISIISALNEQLGLHLERRRVPVSILVVDSVALIPTEN